MSPLTQIKVALKSLDDLEIQAKEVAGLDPADVPAATASIKLQLEIAKTRLLAARVMPTIIESPEADPRGHLRRQTDAKSGLALLATDDER